MLHLGDGTTESRNWKSRCPDMAPAASSASAAQEAPRGCSGCAANKGGVFLITFFSYVMFHASRKSFSAIKGEMSSEQWIHSRVYSEDQQAEMYGLLDTLFMAFYAVGLYIRYAAG